MSEQPRRPDRHTDIHTAAATVQFRFTGAAAALDALLEQIRAALGPVVHVDATRTDATACQRWYGQIDMTDIRTARSGRKSEGKL